MHACLYEYIYNLNVSIGQAYRGYNHICDCLLLSGQNQRLSLLRLSVQTFARAK